MTRKIKLVFLVIVYLKTGEKARGLNPGPAKGGEVVITYNGKPAALMIDTPEGKFDEIVQAVRQARAMAAFNSMRRRAVAQGYMSDEEIEAAIAEARGADGT